MSYTITDSLNDLRDRLEAEKIIAELYPDAYRQLIGDVSIWISNSLEKKEVTAFHIFTYHSGHTCVCFYKELPGDARIYYRGEYGISLFCYLMNRNERCKEAILEMVKRGTVA
jgi:hypothetical protein